MNACLPVEETFPEWLYCFTFPLAIHKTSRTSKSSSALGITSLFNPAILLSVVAPRGVIVGFPWWVMMPSICLHTQMARHAQISFGEESVQIFCPLFKSKFLWAVLTAKWRGKYRDFPCARGPHTCTASLIISVPHQSGCLSQPTTLCGHVIIIQSPRFTGFSPLCFAC